MKNIFLLLFIGLSSLNVSAQEQQILKLTAGEIESRFLSENLELIAEKMNIDIAEAEIVQAKLWDNPELSIGDVNLWSTNEQKEEAEINTFPKNTQFSIELSQLIQTANKRGKLIRREKISKEIAVKNFEEVLRAMKVELRNSINEILYMQSYMDILDNQGKIINRLLQSYSKQMPQGNIAKTELLRLQSLNLEHQNEINEVKTEYNEQQKTLKSLLNASPLVVLYIIPSEQSITVPDKMGLTELFTMAIMSRPDIRRQQLETQYHDRNLSYEKALRVPDITLSASYDRRGGIWKDFVSFGVSFELPFLNRNQGGIKSAKLSKEQSQYLEQQQVNIAQQEIVHAYTNYSQAYNFYQDISDNNLLSEMDEMLNVYTNNFLKRNVSMLEYIDFMDTYKSNKQTVFTAKKNLNTSFEELQFSVGADIK